MLEVINNWQDVSLYDYAVDYCALGQAGLIIIKGKFNGSKTSVCFRNNVVSAGKKGKGEPLDKSRGGLRNMEQANSRSTCLSMFVCRSIKLDKASRDSLSSRIVLAGTSSVAFKRRCVDPQ